jgi:hypothetical protein
MAHSNCVFLTAELARGGRGQDPFASRRKKFSLLVAIISRLGSSELFVAVLQKVGVTVAGVYRPLLYRHCREPLEHTAPLHRAVRTRARETVHI